jgi:hypothetical protein
MSAYLCDSCRGLFQTSEHDCGTKYLASLLQSDANLDFLSRRLEQRVGEHEKTQKELALAQQGIASAVQDIKRLEAEVEKLNYEIMERDTRPEFERGEYAGQDAMMRHIGLLKEDSGSELARAVKRCYFVQTPLRVLAEVAEYLEVAGYTLGHEHDPAAAKDLHAELSILQKRCELFSKDLVQDDG